MNTRSRGSPLTLKASLLPTSATTTSINDDDEDDSAFAASQESEFPTSQDSIIEPSYPEWLARVTADGMVLHKAPKAFQHTKEFVLTACRQNGWALQKALMEFQNDPDIVLEACQKCGWAFKFASPTLRDDKEFVLKACQLSGNVLHSTSKRLRGDVQVVSTACQQNGMALRFALAKPPRHDKTVVLTAVHQTGKALEYASKLLRDDNDVVLQACQQDGMALQYASPRLRDDTDMVIQACKNNGQALESASERLRNDKQVALVACQENGLALGHVSDELRADKSIVLAAASSNPDALKLSLGGLHQDPDCLVASGLWDDQDNTNSPAKRQKTTTTTEPPTPIVTSHIQTSADEPKTEISSDTTATTIKIVLSTKFALTRESGSKATQFAVLFKQDDFIRNGNFDVYSPNAFEKGTCDEEWTRFEWSCRGTFETCQMPAALKTGIPQSTSCWRYSYRHQLKHAQQTRGFMIQLVEVANSYSYFTNRKSFTQGKPQALGKGQTIEREMAQQLSVKVFRIHVPIWRRNQPGNEAEVDFIQEDIEQVVAAIKQWYDEDCKDMSECRLEFDRS